MRFDENELVLTKYLSKNTSAFASVTPGESLTCPMFGNQAKCCALSKDQKLKELAKAE